MELKELTLRDAGTLEKYLGARRHELSVYAPAAVYGWRKIFRIQWALVRSSLCVFFTDATGCFLYLPPLGGAVDGGVVAECFRHMDGVNKHPGISRIENVEREDLPAFGELGYSAVPKSHDYVYERETLAGLRGDRFKSKRAMVNRFSRNPGLECVEYDGACGAECLDLYGKWMAGRAAKNSETVYCGMMSDSRSCLEAVMEDAGALGVRGLAARVGGKIKAFTLGYPLNADTMCVFFEIADLGMKGASQFIFREFCRRAEGYRFVNAMDDSGLENLRRVKESYRPCASVPAYIINRAGSGM